jgi:hypothetical protein
VPVSSFTARRIGLLVLVLVAGAGAAGLGADGAIPANPPRSSLPDTLRFDVEYSGIGAEGVDLVWRGSARRVAPALVTVRVEYTGGEADRRMPVWPVNVLVLYSADDARQSFAAELSGSLNWRTGDLKASGMVTDGARRSVPVEQRLQLQRPGLAGASTVVFLPRLALLKSLAEGM